MANTATLSNLRSSARRKADQENSEFVVDAELDDYINEGVAELHDLLVTVFQDYFKSSENVTLVADTEAYALPSTFYKLLGAFYVSGGIRYPLQQFAMNELGEWEADRIVPVISGQYLRYRIVGNEIFFTPKPNGAGTVELWFVPQPTKLVGNTDTVSYAVVIGWEEYISNHAAIRMLQKEESDSTPLLLRQQKLEQRIRAAARGRNAAAPQRVTDVYSGRRNYPRRRTGY